MAINPNDTGDRRDSVFEIATAAGSPQTVTPTKFRGMELQQTEADLDQQKQLWDNNRRKWRNFERTDQF